MNIWIKHPNWRTHMFQRGREKPSIRLVCKSNFKKCCCSSWIRSAAIDMNIQSMLGILWDLGWFRYTHSVWIWIPTKWHGWSYPINISCNLNMSCMMVMHVLAFFQSSCWSDCGHVHILFICSVVKWVCSVERLQKGFFRSWTSCMSHISHQ